MNNSASVPAARRATGDELPQIECAPASDRWRGVVGCGRLARSAHAARRHPRPGRRHGQQPPRRVAAARPAARREGDAWVPAGRDVAARQRPTSVRSIGVPSHAGIRGATVDVLRCAPRVTVTRVAT